MKKLILTAAMLGLGCAGAVKVGVLIPLTGAGSVTGQAARNGYLLAQDEINRAGGVLGRPLELVFADDGSAAAKATSEFVRLVTVERVDFMAGGSARPPRSRSRARPSSTTPLWPGSARRRCRSRRPSPTIPTFSITTPGPTTTSRRC